MVAPEASVAPTVARMVGMVVEELMVVVAVTSVVAAKVEVEGRTRSSSRCSSSRRLWMTNR